MDRFGPTAKVSKKLVHLLRWTTFPGRTARKFWLNGSRPTFALPLPSIVEDISESGSARLERSLEPVVSWSRGRLQIKPSGSGDENASRFLPRGMK